MPVTFAMMYNGRCHAVDNLSMLHVTTHYTITLLHSHTLQRLNGKQRNILLKTMGRPPSYFLHFYKSCLDQQWGIPSNSCVYVYEFVVWVNSQREFNDKPVWSRESRTAVRQNRSLNQRGSRETTLTRVWPRPHPATIIVHAKLLNSPTKGFWCSLFRKMKTCELAVFPFSGRLIKSHLSLVIQADFWAHATCTQANGGHTWNCHSFSLMSLFGIMQTWVMSVQVQILLVKIICFNGQPKLCGFCATVKKWSETK